MDRNTKRKRLDSEESGNPEIKMMKNVGTRSSSFCLAASSSNDGDSACTSPVLDTANVRRKGKQWTRRAVSDPACPSSLAKLSSPGEIPNIPKTPKRSTVENSHNESLAERLRDLRRQKKPAARLSDLKDARITDEDFVQSVRILDKVCCTAAPAKPLDSPKKSLGLLPFVDLEHLRLSQMQKNAKTHESPEKNEELQPCVDLERLRLSQLQVQKNAKTLESPKKNEELQPRVDLERLRLSQLQVQKNAKTLESPKKNEGLEPSVDLERLRLSQLQTRRKFSPVSHLTLDEDNDEDADMFEDAKDGAEAAEELDEFSQWRYNPADTSASSASSFRGFSSQDYDRSRDLAERVSQNRDVLDEKDNAGFRGFAAADIDVSEKLLRHWKTVLRNNYADSEVWDDWFFEGLDSKITRENSGGSAESAKRPATPEVISRAEDPSEMNSGFVIAGGRELELTQDSWAKSGDLFESTDEPSNEEVTKLKKDPVLPKENEGKITLGFATAGGRELKISQDSWAKSKALLDSIEEPSIDELTESKTDPVPPKKNEGKITSGFATAGGRELKISQDSWAKSKALLDSIEEPSIEELTEPQTDPVPPKKNEGKITSGFATAGGRELKISQDSWAKSKALLDSIEEPSIEELTEPQTDPVPPKKNEGKITSGFATAGGRELKISQDSWAKSKALLDSIEEPSIDELTESKTDPVPPKKNEGKITSGFATAGGRELKISQDSWTKSKALLDSIEEPSIDELTESKTDPVPPKKNEGKITSGFATAGGRELKITEESWTKSKALLESIDEPSIADVENKKETMPSGFSTASGRSIDVSTEAVSAAEAQLFADLDNIESLDFEDFVDPVENPEASTKRKYEDIEASNKRKHEEIEEETPLRRDSSLNKKRGRYVNDLQARKLFNEDSNSSEEFDEARRTSVVVESRIIGWEKNPISEEVDASAAALMEDEERSNEGTTWRINAERKEGSISPELGCEIGNRSRADVSTRNLLGILNRDEPEKVNVDGGSSRAASGSSTETRGNDNDGAASAEKREEPQEIQHESIPDDLTFDSQFSQDIQHSPVIDKFIADAMKIMEGRLAAALKQDEAIRGKRSAKPEPSDGHLYRLRTSNRDKRISWTELTDGVAPTPREISGDSFARDLPSVTADSAASYSFRCADFYGERNVRRNIEGIKVGDGAFLVLDQKNCAGAREFERAFLASPGVDPNLVPTGWVRNHYRWIVWKLASMDRVKFGHKCLPRMLTPDRVMLELKYRYDREIYRMQWPPLRRILERGENASTRLVLCVSSVIAVEEQNAPVRGAQTPSSMGSTMYRMRVSDGWYSIGTSIDAAMVGFIKSGKVREGTKLMICGAKAVNLDQGCSALEIPESVTLRIYSNSTRRARWNTKLDFYRANRGPMSLGLKTVKPNGGAICKLVVAVSRVYPILYREKLPDGQCVFRNARSDEEAARAHEARYQSKMEEIYASTWNEFQMGLTSGKGSGARRRSYTQEEAAACSRDVEEELRQRISSKMSECLPTPRDVTPVMKLRIAEDETSALVTVWSTDRDTTELFVEGSSIAIYNSFASGLRSNELQITASRSTFVKRELSRRVSYPERIYTSLAGVTEAGFNPVYGEFDTIGVVASIGPAPHGMKNFETVNLACPRSGDATASDFLSVLFWQGVSAHGYAKILTVGSLVACSNLEWRRNTSKSIPTAYCTDRSVFSKNPRQSHLVQAFETLRDEIKEPPAYAAACAAVIEEEIAKKSALRTPGGSGTPYRPGTPSCRTPGWSPRDSTGPISATCSTPRIDSRKTTTRERLERLEAYGEPPKLPSIVINNSSRKVLSDFRSPVRTPVTKS